MPLTERESKLTEKWLECVRAAVIPVNSELLLTAKVNGNIDRNLTAKRAILTAS